MTDETVTTAREALLAARDYILDRGDENDMAPVIEKIEGALSALPVETDALREVTTFLLGAGPLEGLWFSDRHPDKAAFWWRKNLAAALSSARYPGLADFVRHYCNASLLSDSEKLSLIASHPAICARPINPR